MHVPCLDTTPIAIQIQGCIPDGARILTFRPASGDRTFFALCNWRDDYVSWCVDIGNGDVLHGIYTRDIVLAVDKYRERK